ncbi:MAG: helix-turn-helix transcriptional regulator [Oscillospiraceae bacterium]|nr:helix-turn-helix transcriptional regulator [Oscillospiraceae bacterium]
MNGLLLGKRLKEARLSKKMTQSDVVGGYITRNMLSQIESGAAFPSIRTLEYLSGVLEVPMAELMSGIETERSGLSLAEDLKTCVRLLSPYLEEDSSAYKEIDAIIRYAEAALEKIAETMLTNP